MAILDCRCDILSLHVRIRIICHLSAILCRLDIVQAIWQLAQISFILDVILARSKLSTRLLLHLRHLFPYFGLALIHGSRLGGFRYNERLRAV